MLALICLLALNQQWFLRADYYLFDMQIKRIAKQQVADKDIVVIAIDDYSLTAMNKIAGRWVWPRSVHAELIEGLNQYQPNIIAFDILFSEKDIYRPDADNYFNEVIAESKNTYFSMLVLETEGGQGQAFSQYQSFLPLVNQQLNSNARAMLLLPFAINPEYWRLGTINYQAEVDGVGRYYSLFQEGEGWQLYSLASTLLKALGKELPDKNKFLLNWRGDNHQPYKTYSYVDVYQAVINNDHEFLQQFQQKTILVGTTSAGLYDARTTPVNHNFPGVYVLATALDNLKHDQHLSQFEFPVLTAISIALLLITASCFYLLSTYSFQLLAATGCWLVSCLALYGINGWFISQNIVIFIAAPILICTAGVLSYSFAFGYLEFLNRRKALTMFGRFLDPNVVLNLLGKGHLSAEHLNQKTQITVLFSDIRGFTQLSEQHAANEMLTLLNQYFEKQVSVIFDTKGTLDKFIGDCIMAFWGAPISTAYHAEQAIEAALIMQDNLANFKQTLPAHLRAFDVGIGIHSGEAIAGLVGTAQRVDYTVIGDVVNLASRIEGLTKDHSRILVSEQTMLLAKEKYSFEYQGEFSVKGRKAQVKLYQPLRR